MVSSSGPWPVGVHPRHSGLMIFVLPSVGPDETKLLLSSSPDLARPSSTLASGHRGQSSELAALVVKCRSPSFALPRRRSRRPCLEGMAPGLVASLYIRRRSPCFCASSPVWSSSSSLPYFFFPKTLIGATRCRCSCLLLLNEAHLEWIWWGTNGGNGGFLTPCIPFISPPKLLAPTTCLTCHLARASSAATPSPPPSGHRIGSPRRPDHNGKQHLLRSWGRGESWGEAWVSCKAVGRVYEGQRWKARESFTWESENNFHI